MVFLVAAAACAQDTAPAIQKATCVEKIAALIADFESNTGGTVGACIVDLPSGRGVYSHNDRRAFIPASNQKILTAAFALVRLGAGFHFTTGVYSLGDDLVITGDGDPLTGDPVVAAAGGWSIYREPDRWAAAVKGSIGSKINGDLVLCGRIAPDRFYHPDWTARHRARWYGAPVAWLNFHDNCFDVTFVRRGGKIVPHVSPASSFIRIIDKTRPGGRHLWRLQAGRDVSVVTLSGTVKSSSGDPLSAPVGNPPMLLGRVFAGRLARAGVKLGGTIRRAGPGEVDISKARLLAVTKTPLADVLNRANKRSLNLPAECMFRRAGDGTWDRSAEIMRRTLIKEFNLDDGALVIRDGGGLSRKNRVSPRNITTLLAALADRPDGAMFIASLARSGIDGSLRNRLKRRATRGRIAGKTGTIAGVKCLSGYVLAADGSAVLGFSILANNLRGQAGWRAKKLQDRICELLIEICE